MVERVVNVWPQEQVTAKSLYSGCTSVFIFKPLRHLYINTTKWVQGFCLHYEKRQKLSRLLSLIYSFLASIVRTYLPIHGINLHARLIFMMQQHRNGIRIGLSDDTSF